MLANAKLLQAGILPNPSLSFSMDFPILTSGGPGGVGHAVPLRSRRRRPVRPDLRSLWRRLGQRRANGRRVVRRRLVVGLRQRTICKGYNFGLEWDVTALISARPRSRQPERIGPQSTLMSPGRSGRRREAVKSAFYALVAMDAEVTLERQVRSACTTT